MKKYQLNRGVIEGILNLCIIVVYNKQYTNTVYNKLNCMQYTINNI